MLVKSLALLPKTLHFAELARAEGVDHLHAHWATYPANTALVVSRLTGIPWSLTCHAHDIFFEPLLLAEKLAETSFVLTCTGDNKRHLETVSPHARAKVTVSYHGLDLGRFRPDPDRAPGPRPRLLGVGSLLECKGFDLLIAACGLLAERRRDFELTIAGGGPEEDKLRQAAAAAGVADRVRFTGYLTQDDLLPLYRAADLFVLPAVLEIHWGIPNVLVEALACEVPVITTALPSLKELVSDGVHGLVARNRDHRDLAEKIDRLLADPERRRAMGRAGRARVEEIFDIERTIDQVVQALLARPAAAAADRGAA
jgi:glycosyltransferase involved in cell wall biosynthesis